MSVIVASWGNDMSVMRLVATKSTPWLMYDPLASPLQGVDRLMFV